MELPRRGKEYYRLDIGTVPSLLPTQWSASFNDGTSWVPAINSDGKAAWLVAGPDCADTTGATLIIADIQPLVQLLDNPEIVIRTPPAIKLV
jgi:hypothetical protein